MLSLPDSQNWDFKGEKTQKNKHMTHVKITGSGSTRFCI